MTVFTGPAICSLPSWLGGQGVARNVCSARAGNQQEMGAQREQRRLAFHRSG